MIRYSQSNDVQGSVSTKGRFKMKRITCTAASVAVFFLAFGASAASVTVTDENVVGEVWVGNGETLSVYGNGLGADATLVLDGGSTVKFFATAEIACPIIATNLTVKNGFASVYLYTSSASVTGTVSSVISSASKSRLFVNPAPGFIILSGSGSMTHFYMDSGRADVTGQYDISATQLFYGGHLKIRDGGRMSVVGNWQYLRLDKTETGKSAILEVATGGVFEKSGGNEYTYLGTGNAAKPSKILVTGGRFKHDSVQFNFSAGGSIEVESGTFETHAPIRCWDSATAENANILLKGGRAMFLGGGAGYCPCIFADPAPDSKQTGIGRCSVTIDGSVRLVLGYQPKMPDSPDDTGRATWKCTPGSRLNIVGSGYEVTTMLHNFEADGLAFDFNVPSGQGLNKSTVAIADRTDTVGAGFVLPGTAGCRLITTNSSPALAVSYVAPAGQTLDVADLPDWWHDGFSQSSVSNIVLDAGSTLKFPFFPGSPLAISGSLTLPAAANFRVDAGGEALRTTAPTAVVVPADGVGGETDCAWTCLGSTRAERSVMSVADGRLCFSYIQPAMLLLVR